MEKMVVNGGARLDGKVTASSAKNAVLPAMAASLLSSSGCLIAQIPDLEDVRMMEQVLKFLGAEVMPEDGALIIDTSNLAPELVPDTLMRQMRASNLVMGPLLGRFGVASVAYPGGCNIGSRPMDLHLKGFRKLGAEVSEKYGVITVKAAKLQAANINLDYPSVGATENLMMAAVLAPGTTTLRNAAREPEIVDLQNMLNRMGARIKGAGTDLITIEGVARIDNVRYKVIPDRIEVGTHMVAAAITGGDVLIDNAIVEHVEPVIAKLLEAGLEVKTENNRVRVRCSERVKALEINTLPYPGFPTDMQPQMMALMSTAAGTSLITETVFENRFKHADELRRLGAKIKVLQKTAVIEGVNNLSGAVVEATDLRAAAALILAGLAAEGTTTVENLHHLDRGYCHLEKKYQGLGADLFRIDEVSS